MKTLATILGSALVVLVIQHNDQLHLVERYEDGSIIKDIERVQLLSDDLDLPVYMQRKLRVDANYREIGEFRDQWLCATKKDVTKCRPERSW